MQFLPIVDRELRVASRHARTWWQRVLTTGVALLLFGFVMLAIGGRLESKYVGREIFTALGWVGMIYALLSGPFATADCLSRERREGTLGLLFLTDLRSYDVVLGKIAAASLDVVLALVAALPVVAMPILMGGVSLPQLAFVALTLVNSTFLSLALGACASAATRSGRSALAITLGILFLLTLGLIILGEGILDIPFRSPSGWCFYMLCPSYAMEVCLGRTFALPRWDFWLNIGATHLLGWLCLLIAACRTANSWRDLPASGRLVQLEARFERWRKGSGRLRWKRRLSMLHRNPVAWLEGRDRLPERVLWGSLLVAAITGAILHLRYPDKFPDEGWLILLPIMAHYGLCVMIAIDVPRRLADDRESGALELLLCTPLRPADIVSGCMTVLRRRFGLTLLALLTLELYFAYLFCGQHGGWARFWDTEIPALYLTGLAVFPIQAYTMARVGLYQGLVAANSLRATFTAAAKVGLLPWVIWIVTMLTLESIRSQVRGSWNIDDKLVCAAWAASHLLVCGSFLAHSTWRLRWHFRSLAARTLEPPWWKLRLRFLGGASRFLAAPQPASPQSP